MEVGNFRAIVTNGAVPSGTQTTQVVSLAQISDHLSDTTTIQGALDAWKLRNCSVFGIVFSANSFLNQAPVAAISAHAIVDMALYYDRLNAAGSPTTFPLFQQNTPPMIAANTVSTSNVETTMPTRILWRETRVLPIGANDIGLPHPQNYYAGSRSLRPRLRLTDEFGLFFAFGVFASTGGNTSWSHVVAGSLYWRAGY